MQNLRLRVKLNKGRRGISLEKLEKFVVEMRKFLMQAGDDLSISEPKKWIGVDFEDGSLSFTNESALPQTSLSATHFNDSIIALGKSEFPPYLQETTANQFFKVAGGLDLGDTADIAVFDGEIPIWFEISQRTGILARKDQLLPYRITQGAVQGTIHNIFIENEKPYFTLRELSTQKLIKCYFNDDDYAAVVETLKRKGQILHIRGTVVADTQKRNIEHVTVTRIIPSEPYSYADVEKFLGNNWRQ